MAGQLYRLITDEAEARAGFAKWRSALLDFAAEDRGLWRLPDQNFVFRSYEHKHGNEFAKVVALGFDPTGANWVLQINERDRPGNANVLSAIAEDKVGRQFLVRQGRLQRNSLSSTVLEGDFAKRTGLEKLIVENGDTLFKKRDWYIVAPLDDRAAAIRSATALFVDMCAAARGVADMPTEAELEVLRQLYGADETGGAYTQSAKDAQPEKIIAKVQGDVWAALAVLIRGSGGLVRKPCVGGYEADAQIVSKKQKLLVEIKTSVIANDIYAGVGQLALYRKMMPELADHTPVLLLPKLPKPIVKQAVEACGITICTFGYDDGGSKPQTSFDAKFLDLCGLSP